jgi:hypothetical protein
LKSAEPKPPDAELVVAVFRTVAILVALLAPQLLNARAEMSSPRIWLAVVAGAYNLLIIAAYLLQGQFRLRRPFIIAMDIMLVTLWIRLSSEWGLFPLYYIVVIVAAMWYRVIGGVLTALCCNFLFVFLLLRNIAETSRASLQLSPPPPPLSIWEAFTLLIHSPFLSTGFALNIALLFFIGSLVGSLAQAQERERTRRLEEQLLLANYQREIDIATQLQPLLVVPHWLSEPEADGEAQRAKTARTTSNRVLD